MRVPKTATEHYEVHEDPVKSDSRILRQAPSPIPVKVHRDNGEPVDTEFTVAGHAIQGDLPTLRRILQILGKVIDLIEEIKKDHDDSKAPKDVPTPPPFPPRATGDGEF